MSLTPIARSSFELFTETLSPVRSLIMSSDISEIMINNHESIWVEQNGRMEKTDIVLNKSQLHAGIKYLSSGVGNIEAVPGTNTGVVNAAHNNMRIAAVMYPTAIDGDALCIRKHSNSEYSADQYLENGSFDIAKINQERNNISTEIEIVEGMENQQLVNFIHQEIRNRKNFIIAGGTNAGKTSLLNMFLKFIPDDQRVITIEDTEELKVKVPNKVRLLSNKSQGVTAQLLVELCLRMRPDRIVAGEVRGAEALDFLQALNTGHDGGFASLHAKNAEMALIRLESLAMRGLPPGVQMSPEAIKRDINDCIDYVIHFKKSSTSRFRFLNEMVKLMDVVENRFTVKKVF